MDINPNPHNPKPPHEVPFGETIVPCFSQQHGHTNISM